MKKLIFFIVSTTLLFGCSHQPIQQQITSSAQTEKVSTNFNKLMKEDDLYVIFQKDKEGRPLKLIKFTPKHEDVLAFFKNSTAIEDNDCIRIDEYKTDVCDIKWLTYGVNHKTKLTTTEINTHIKMADPLNSATMLTAGAIHASFAILTDALSLNLTMKNTREKLNEMYVNKVVNIEELNLAKQAVLPMIQADYIKQKEQAMKSTESALEFVKKYPNDNNTSIIEAGLQRAVHTESDKEKAIAFVLNNFTVSSVQKTEGINALRNLHTFNSFVTAFDFSNEAQDAKNAQKLAHSENDKRKIEYIAFKLLTAKKNALSSVFNLSVNDISGKEIKKEELRGFFNENNQGNKDFSFLIKIKTKNELGIFKYGTYDVSIKVKLKVSTHFYQRSTWLGNADVNQTKEYTEDKVIRISPPKFSESVPTEFKDVLISYLERGDAGGITEITLIEAPSVEVEVTNVALVK